MGHALRQYIETVLKSEKKTMNIDDDLMETAAVLRRDCTHNFRHDMHSMV